MSAATKAGRRRTPLRFRSAAAAWLALWVCCRPLPAGGAEPADGPPRERLHAIDLDGRLHRPADGPDRRGALFVFLSTACPISNGYVPELKSLSAVCRQRHIDFYGVLSDPSVGRREALRHRDEFRLSFPVLFDTSGELRRNLSATHTPHAFLVDRGGRTVYSGRIDDLYSALGRRRDAPTVRDLREALDAFAADRPIATPVTQPVGCLLEATPAEATGGEVTFHRDVAPLLYAHCSECHRPGESAPFPLLTYEDAVRHARQIAAVTQSRFMPPWHPVPGFGRFRNERRLTDFEIARVARWVADGMPAGDSADELAPPQFTDGWRLGKPDLILKMPEAFELAADGPDVHQHFVLPTGLDRHRLVSAVEFRPGTPRVTHHASFYIDVTGAGRKLASLTPDLGYGSFVGPGFPSVGSLRSWLPGMSPQHLPEGTGQLLQARSDLIVEIHYRRSGKVETDRSVVGLHFAKSDARQLVGEFQVANKELTIPAGAARHHHTASFTLPVDATLLDTVPHMHLLGREMKAVAVRPDGEVVPLVWITDWDFNWQGQYLYSEPPSLPAGTRIDVEAWFDNSAENPLNPHSPPQTVTWGEETQDEMAVCQFRYTTRTVEDLAELSAHYIRYAEEQQRVFERLQQRRP